MLTSNVISHSRCWPLLSICSQSICAPSWEHLNIFEELSFSWWNTCKWGNFGKDKQTNKKNKPDISLVSRDQHDKRYPKAHWRQPTARSHHCPGWLPPSGSGCSAESRAHRLSLRSAPVLITHSKWTRVKANSRFHVQGAPGVLQKSSCLSQFLQNNASSCRFEFSHRSRLWRLRGRVFWEVRVLSW